MPSISDIIEFLKKEIGTDKVNDNSDIVEGLGCYGDDFHELMEKFSILFKVDMKDYLWYFHTEEEGFGSIGGLFFKPPNSRVERIIITPAILHEMAVAGKWNIQYPVHQLPPKRYDLLMNKLILILFLIIALIYWFNKL